MKHAFTLGKTSLLAFVMILSVVFACKDDEDPDPKPVDNNPIAATWQLTAITPETPGTIIPAIEFAKASVACLFNLKLTFKTDNSITAADCSAAVSAIDPIVPISEAKWKVDGDKLVLSRGATSQSFKYTQTATELKIVVNTNTDTTKPAVNAVLIFKKL
jgi:hypothetical protein